MTRLVPLLIALSLLAAACGTATPLPATPSVSATASLSATRTASATPRPPTSTVTPKPIEGTLTIRVNVRSGPGTTYDSLGLLNAGEKVSILHQNSQKTWYQIVYASAPSGAAWVAAQYVQVEAGVEIPLEATPTPAGPSGSVVQRLNVRSGPGTSFDSLGLLEAGVTVSLTGKNSTASWFQIEYAAAPQGLGWVTAQYIQTEAADKLPVLDDYGTPVATGAAETPSDPALTPTPTVGPAFDDGDSQAAPAVRVDFSAVGTRQFTYSSQVSAPEGDAEDWVEFTPYAAGGADARLIFSLSCSGNGALTVELWQNGSLLSNWGTLECGDAEKPVTLPAGQACLLRLSPEEGEGLRLVNYTLTVQNKP